MKNLDDLSSRGKETKGILKKRKRDETDYIRRDSKVLPDAQKEYGQNKTDYIRRDSKVFPDDRPTKRIKIDNRKSVTIESSENKKDIDSDIFYNNGVWRISNLIILDIQIAAIDTVKVIQDRNEKTPPTIREEITKIHKDLLKKMIGENEEEKKFIHKTLQFCFSCIAPILEGNEIEESEYQQIEQSLLKAEEELKNVMDMKSLRRNNIMENSNKSDIDEPKRKLTKEVIAQQRLEWEKVKGDVESQPFEKLKQGFDVIRDDIDQLEEHFYAIYDAQQLLACIESLEMANLEIRELYEWQESLEKIETSFKKTVKDKDPKATLTTIRDSMFQQQSDLISVDMALHKDKFLTKKFIEKKKEPRHKPQLRQSITIVEKAFNKSREERVNPNQTTEDVSKTLDKQIELIRDIIGSYLEDNND